MSVYRRGAVWYYDFRLDGRRHVRRVGPSRELAEKAEQRARERALGERFRREWGPPPGRARRAVTVQSFLDTEYAPALRQRLSRLAAANQLSILGGFARHFGRVRLMALTRKDLEGWLGERARQVSANFVRHEAKTLRRFLRHAATLGCLRENPAHQLAVPRETRTPDRILSPAEETRFFAACRRPIVALMFQLMLYTGLRRGEVVNLRWRDVHLEERRLALVQPKTTRLKRLPLTSALASALTGLRRPGDGPLDYVFRQANGQPFSPDGFTHLFMRIRARARLSGLRLHDLRHTAATRLARQGEDLATIGEILGHTPPYRETLRYFAHTNESRMRAALERLAGPREA